MKAILMREPGGPEVLTETELPTPVVEQPTDLLVRLAAAGVNPIDTKIRARGPLLPDRLTAVPGCDGAGVVEAVGDGVRRFKPGDAVWFCHGGLGGPNGNYAEYIVVDEAVAQPKPRSLDFVHAAAAPLVLITAWEALYDRARLHEGQRVLIHAGAGGVGHVAIQLARLAGARVAATVSSPRRPTMSRTGRRVRHQLSQRGPGRRHRRLDRGPRRGRRLRYRRPRGVQAKHPGHGRLR
jgi:NADPH2:quinone reductase